jgi:RimJ/RimL family protein N-acetyltransferase
MDDYPRLVTPRLLLRAFTPADAPHVAQLAGDRAIADTTMSVPHPYPPDAALAWIAGHAQAWSGRTALPLAITQFDSGELIGAVGLNTLSLPHRHAELGYWIGRPFWSHGYATEAAAALVGFAFQTLALHRVYAHHMTRNPASGRVMRKLGMTHEGTLRQHVCKWGAFEDVELYGVLRGECEKSARQPLPA